MQHEFVELLEFFIRDFMRFNLNTSFPAEVVNVKEYNTKQFVDIKPLIHAQYPDGILETSVIYSVPVIFPSGGGALFSCPLGVGDTVLAMVSQRCLSSWLVGDGSRAAETDFDNFDLNDAMAIPGLYTSQSNLSPNPDDVEIKFKDMSFKLEAGGSITLETSSGGLELKPSGEVEHSSGAKITATGDFVTAAGVSLNNHFHTQPNDSAGDTQSPTAPPTPTEV